MLLPEDTVGIVGVIVPPTGSPLRPCYAMPGTCIAYEATPLLCDARYCYGVSTYVRNGTGIVYPPTPQLRNVMYCHSVWYYQPRYEMLYTGIVYLAM
eukprot:1543743-Rhodomonas_salina.1